MSTPALSQLGSVRLAKGEANRSADSGISIMEPMRDLKFGNVFTEDGTVRPVPQGSEVDTIPHT